MLRLVILVFFTGMPHIAHALGLGRLIVSSGLDEPLNGRIELISPTAQELKTLKVSLASREEFDIAGVERGALLFELKYDVVQEANGRYAIRVTTLQPVREPFLHFLVRVEWSGGRLVREYSTLLDPPQWAAGAPTEIDIPPVIPATPEPVAPQKSEALSTEQPQPVEELPPLVADEMAVPAAPASAEAVKTAPAAADTAEAAKAEKSQLAGEGSATPQPTAATPAPVVDESAKLSEPATPEKLLSDTGVAPAPISTPAPVVTEVPPAPAQPAEIAPAAAEAPVAPQAAKAAKAAAQEFGPVIRGDTLTQIAAKLGYDRGVTSQQVMIALLRANPSAFYKGNVNILYAGKILKVPERDRVATIPVQEASRELHAQYDAWQEYKLKLAGASRLTTTPSVKGKKGEVVAEAAKPAGTKAAKQAKAAAKPDKSKKDASKAQPIDLLKIVRASLEHEIPDDAAKTPGVETSAEGGKEKAKLTEKVATLEEAIESKQMQNKELRERVGKLQEQNKNAERLIEIENKDLAQAQKQAAEKQAAEEKALADAANKAKQEAAALEKAAAAAAKKAEQEKAATPKPAEPVKPAVPKQPVAPVASQTEENFLDTLLAAIKGFGENTLALTVLAGIGAIAAALGGFYFVRRRRATRGFSESILSSSSLTSESSITDTTNPQASTDTSFLSDFSQGGAGNVHHTDEVDPIAEAEVYLAYGRDEQAEEILRDAITKDPTRQEVRGKLLEIYFQRNDVAAFETVAEELYASLEGKGGKVWEKAEEMGRKLSPGNPMFSGQKPASRPQASSTAATTMLMPESGLAFDSDASSPTLVTSAATSLEFEVPSASAAPAPEASSGLDFSLNFDAPPSATQPASALDMSLDFDAGTSAGAAPASGGMDMDFSLSDTAVGAETSSNAIDFSMPSAAPEPASDGLDFTMSPTPEAESGGLDFTMPTAALPASDGLDFTLSSTTESTAGDLDFSGFETTASETATDVSDTNVIDFSAAGGDTALEFESTATEIHDAAGAGGLPGWDETATKLDLAKAYIDMGDAEGARSILDEVMAEGNESQKKQARDLASQIAA